MNPERYVCANPKCERTLLPAYDSRPILPLTRPERIHRVVDPTVTGFTVLCGCGHYTVVAPNEEP
jgi:hypothetical protein